MKIRTQFLVFRPLAYLALLSLVTTCVFVSLRTVVASQKMLVATYSADTVQVASQVLWLALFAGIHYILKTPNDELSQAALTHALTPVAYTISTLSIAFSTHYVAAVVYQVDMYHAVGAWGWDELVLAIYAGVLVRTSWRLYKCWSKLAQGLRMISLKQAEEHLAAALHLLHIKRERSRAALLRQAAIRSLQPIARRAIAEGEDCAICLRGLLDIHDGRDGHPRGEIVRIPLCGHTFCKHDIVSWIASGNGTCPLCRRIFARLRRLPSLHQTPWEIQAIRDHAECAVLRLRIIRRVMRIWDKYVNAILIGGAAFIMPQLCVGAHWLWGPLLAVLLRAVCTA